MTKTILSATYLYLLCCIVTLSACKTTKKPKNTSNPALIVTPGLGSDTTTSPLPDYVNELDPVPANYSAKPERPSRKRLHDLLHTKLEVSLNWEKSQLDGIATLVLKPYFYPQKELVLDAKGFDIHSVKLIKGNQNIDLKYEYDRRKLRIRLDKEYTRRDKYTVEIDYTAKPEDLPKGGSDAITSDIGLYFVNANGKTPNKPRQVWTQGETEASSCWFPTIDSPNERCTQEMYITVDKKFTTLSNGTLIYSRDEENNQRTDYWRMDLPHAPYLFMLAVGEFAVVKDKWRGKPVNYYVEKKYAPYAKAIFGNTPEMLEFFSKKLNYPFPWSKYSQIVVRDFVSGAMENTTASVFMEDLQVDDRALLDAYWDGIIAHELIHQWFGDLVTCESWANLPLNEAFANYGEYLWAEYKYGVEEADYLAQQETRGYLNEAESKQVPLIRYNYQHREDMFDAHSYNKGGRVLHMLRKYVGDEAFWRALNLYLTRNRFKAVEIHDLRSAFEEVTGEDLRWFFDQWFFSPGHPKISVTHRYENGKLYLATKQLQDNPYVLPMKIAAWIDNTRKVWPITIDSTKQTFEFAVPSKPQAVVFDAEQQLLALVKHPKTNDELTYQYLHEPTYKARMEVIDKLYDREQLTSVLWDVFFKALNDRFWRIRERAIEKFESYKGDKLQNLKQILQKLAVDDPKTTVRAAAINVLASFADKNRYKALFAKGLKARSYVVVAASLKAYMQTDATDISEKIANFEQYTATEVVEVVANYYEQKPEPQRLAWFTRKIKEPGSNKMAILESFGVYLFKSKPETQQKGTAFLSKFIKTTKNKGSKFLAYKALTLLRDNKDVAKLLLQIKQQETDKELKAMYDLLD